MPLEVHSCLGFRKLRLPFLHHGVASRIRLHNLPLRVQEFETHLVGHRLHSINVGGLILAGLTISEELLLLLHSEEPYLLLGKLRIIN